MLFGQLSLSQLRALGGASLVQQAGAAVLVTGVGRARLDAELQFEEPETEARDRIIRVRLIVETGKLDLGWIDERDPGWAARASAVPSPEPAVVGLNLPRGHAAGRLVFENASEDGRPAVAIIESIEIWDSEADSVPAVQTAQAASPQRSYRIGFLNPWREKAENQAFASLEMAAKGIGHALIEVTNSDEILAADLDFVLAAASTQPKTTEIPTFGVIHEPRVRFWEQESYFENLLTYDGYLTISDTLERFLKSFCAGAGKPPQVGRYFNTPQRQDIACDLEGVIGRGALGLCYFGTNWDPRMRPIFRALAERPFMRIYGPPEGWEYLHGIGYRGAVPFDGQSVQRIYAEHGAGFVTCSRHHALDDVVSNRIFEISSVGAVAICPDLPWFRKNFADAVFYYDPFADVGTVVRQVEDAVEEMRLNPHGAAQRAARAREVFDKNFAAEVMLANAVAYFEGWRQSEGKPSDASGDPLIDVIVRVGGRPVQTILRAVRSIENQLSGRFRIIFVRYRPIDLWPIVNGNPKWARIDGFDIVDEPGGDRAATLVAGLRAVRSEYFAVLDDDDFWLPGHVRSLLAEVSKCPPGRGYAFSGYLEVEEPPPSEIATARERRRIANLRTPSGDIFNIMGTFAPHCWLASSTLLKNLDLSGWTLQTAEDTLLQSILIAYGEPIFTYRATACTVRGSVGASNFLEAGTRDEDVFECFLRLQTVIDRVERKFVPPSMSNWARLNWALHRVLRAKHDVLRGEGGVLVLEEGVPALSLRDRGPIESREIALTASRVSLMGASEFVELENGPALSILPSPEPWSYGANICLDDEDLRFEPRWAVLEFGPSEWEFAAGILNEAGDEFVTRMEVPASTGPVEIWLGFDVDRKLARIVVQNWTRPCLSSVLLRRAWLAKENSR